MQSKMEWNGSSAQRFNGNRAHIRPEDSLGSGLAIYQSANYGNGKRCFDQIIKREAPQKKFLRTYDQSYLPSDKEIDFRGKKQIEFTPSDAPPRCQRLHISQSECKDQRKLRGVKTYDEANGPSSNHYNLEQRLQRKARILGLGEQRNGLGVNALGDKDYKYPDYAVNFYKEGGLIVGSTNKSRVKQNEPPPPKIIPLTKPNWKQKVKMEEEEQDLKYLRGIETWEQTTLKEMNPNWKDPDRPPGGDQPPKVAPKDVKKAGKK